MRETLLRRPIHVRAVATALAGCLAALVLVIFKATPWFPIIWGLAALACFSRLLWIVLQSRIALTAILLVLLMWLPAIYGYAAGPAPVWAQAIMVVVFSLVLTALLFMILQPLLAVFALVFYVSQYFVWLLANLYVRNALSVTLATISVLSAMAFCWFSWRAHSRLVFMGIVALCTTVALWGYEAGLQTLKWQ